MSPDAQRIAIAEACGLGDYGTRMSGWHENEIAALPDYLGDLNAMHEAEATLRFDDRHRYIDLLGETYHDSWEFCTATATQRAEAFLRTLDLWTP